MIAEAEIINKPKIRLNPFQTLSSITTMERAISGSVLPENAIGTEGDTRMVNDQKWLILDKANRIKPGLVPLEQKNDEPITFSTENSVRAVDDSQLKRLVEFKPASLDDERFKVLQKWEGKVIQVENGVFWAELKNMTNSLLPDEEVEMELEEIFIDDQELVEVGAAFYWSIGNVFKSHGQQLRSSEIRFKRIPGWTEEEIAKAKKRSEIFRSSLNLDCGK